MYATSLISQTTLRTVTGQAELDRLLSHREMINTKLKDLIDLETEPWGIKVLSVSLKNVDLPAEMIRAMSRQAEAERDKRAKIIKPGPFTATNFPNLNITPRSYSFKVLNDRIRIINRINPKNPPNTKITLTNASVIAYNLNFKKLLCNSNLFKVFPKMKKFILNWIKFIELH